MEVETLSQPLDCLEHLTKFNPDVLITDVYMPECSGPELAQIIRQDDAWMTLPIIFLSSEADLDKQISAIDQGGDIFLKKPVEPDHLITTVKAKAKRARWTNQSPACHHE
jgi:PleD family two-component response regulator